eukprot:GILI01011218.1.p1 GENE.GILI01011218.1~~GILI01011218.1.p1  ORF type:complete len:114 (-),score=32.26 GILI01011218.1:190-531(-)
MPPAKNQKKGGLWKKRSNGEWVKDDLLDELYWTKQILCVLCGLLWGFVPLTGTTGHVAFGAVLFFVMNIYMNKLLEVDPEDFGGQFELITDGMQPGYFGFLMSWIISYSVFHH